MKSFTHNKTVRQCMQMVIWLSLLACLFSVESRADTPATKDLSAETLKWEEELAINPKSLVALHNLGWLEYQLDRKGYAVARWRTSVFMAPFLNPSSKNLSLAEAELRIGRRSEGLGQITHWVQFPIAQISPLFWATSSAVFFFASLFVIAKYFRYQRRTLEFGERPGSAPIQAFAFPALFALFFLLFAVSQWLWSHTLGTVLEGSQPVLSRPSFDSLGLFETKTGELVEIVDAKEDQWILIRTASGQSGWTPSAYVFEHRF